MLNGHTIGNDTKVEGTEERTSGKVPVLLECGHTISIDESELDWNRRYFCGICGHDSIM